MRSEEPTSTSFAILGLLAVRPSTAYDLAQQMDRSLRHFWPRAESRVYEEPKRLVRMGLARATVETVGRRARTVYTITAKGRAALRRWLRDPAGGPQLEFESLLKVFFAEHGTKPGALAQIQAIASWAEERTTQNIRIPRSYVDGDVPYPERLAQIVVVGRFLTDFTDMVSAWSDWARGVVDEWPDPPVGADPDWATIRAVADRPLPGSPAVARRSGARADSTGRDGTSDRSDAEDAVRAVEAAYDSAWSSGDVEAVVACLGADAVVVDPRGQVTIGRDAMRDALGRFLTGEARGSQHHSTIGRVSFIRHDVAVVDGVATISFGSSKPEMVHRFTDIVARDATGRWEITHVRAHEL